MLTMIFFYPVFWGFVPLPSDLIVGGYYPWLDYHWGGFETNVPVKNSLITDAVSLTFPLKNFMAEQLNKGELPLWNPLMFGGYPFIASMPLGFFFPTTVFYLMFDVLSAWSAQVIFQVLIALFGMFLFVRHLKLSVLASIFSALGFGFGGFMLIWLEWNSQAATAAILPLLFFGVSKYLQEEKALWGVVFGLFVCLAILAGLMQITFFSFLALGFYTLYMLWGEKRSFEKLIKVAGFGLLGIIISSVFLIPALELVFYSQRLFEVVNEWEKFLPLEFLLTILAPDFFGNQTTANFWAVHNYTNVSMYTGTITVILAAAGIWRYWDKKVVRFMLYLLLATFVLVTRNPISEIVYRLGIWGGESMTMNRGLFLANFAMATLGGYGIDGLRDKNFYKKYLIISLGTLGILVFSGVIVFLMKGNLITESHAYISLRNLVIPIGLTTFLIILFFIFAKIRTNISILLQVILILTLTVELFRFGWKFDTFSKRDYVFPQTKLIEFMQNHKESRFVSEIDVLPPNMWLPYNLQTIEGYDSVYPLSTAKIIAAINSGSTGTRPQTKHGVVEKFDSPLLPFLGTRYYVTVKRDVGGGINEGGKVNPLFNNDRFLKVFEDHSVVVYENLQSLNKLYWANQVFYMDDKLGLAELARSDEYLQHKRVFNNEFFFQAGENDLISPTNLKLKNSEIMVATNNSKAGYLVFSETFYPGWKVFVDGKERKIYRTNFGFMGVFVPGGSKFVEFKFMPYSLFLGGLLSCLGILGIFVILFISKRNIKFF